MIVVKKNGELIINKKKYLCSYGYSGFKKKKIEGDGSTPIGIFKINKVYYRKDRIKFFKTKIKKIPIRKNMGWCDDTKSRYYNKIIRIPSKIHHEKLYRKDNLYDLIIIIEYNTFKIIKGKGSAIFIHIAKKNYLPTKGCLALNKVDLLEILSLFRKKEKISILK